MTSSFLSWTNVENILGYVGVFVSVSSLYRDRLFHKKAIEANEKFHVVEIAQQNAHHQNECDLAKRQHEEEIKVSQEAHIREINSTLEQHFHQLNADLINATKESERDMYDQRNAEFQTLILCSTVMFAALTTVIIQGQLPSQLGQYVYIPFSAISGLSFAFLFFCIVLCTKIVLRSTLFMYRRANKQSKRVYGLIEQTIYLMGKLRNRNYPLHDRNNRAIERIHDNFFLAHNKGIEKIDTVISPTTSYRNLSTSIRRSESGLSRINNNNNNNDSTPDLEEQRQTQQLDNSRLNIQNVLNDMDFMNNNETKNDVIDNDQTNFDLKVNRIRKSDQETRPGTFEHFWMQHCERQGKLAVWFFYSGTCFMLISVAIYAICWFHYRYDSDAGAYIMGFCLSAALVLGMAFVLLMDDEPEYKDMFTAKFD